MISVCVATNRPAFARWLAGNFQRLDYGEKELVVVVDAPAEAFDQVCADFEELLGAAGPWRAYRLEGADLTAGKLFDHAMQEACGEYLAFRSDDSWWHPRSLDWLAEAAAASPKSAFVGYSNGWFVDLKSKGCTHFRTEGPIVATSVFHSRVRDVRWGPSFKASDTSWMLDVARKYGAGHVVLGKQRRYPHHLWLCHGRNTNKRDYKFETPLERVVAPLSVYQKLDLSVELRKLEERLWCSKA